MVPLCSRLIDSDSSNSINCCTFFSYLLSKIKNKPLLEFHVNEDFCPHGARAPPWETTGTFPSPEEPKNPSGSGLVLPPQTSQINFLREQTERSASFWDRLVRDAVKFASVTLAGDRWRDRGGMMEG